MVIDTQMKEMTTAKLKTPEELSFDRAKFLVNQALDLEEDDIENDGETIKLYTEAVQRCLEAVMNNYNLYSSFICNLRILLICCIMY